MLLAVPIGLAVALVTSEDFLPDWVRSPIAFVVELIAAIPSVIIGLWGIYILIPFLTPLQDWLYNKFQVIPLFNTQSSGPSMLIAGIILAIMIVPTMAAISRDVLLVIPVNCEPVLWLWVPPARKQFLEYCYPQVLRELPVRQCWL